MSWDNPRKWKVRREQAMHREDERRTWSQMLPRSLGDGATLLAPLAVGLALLVALSKPLSGASATGEGGSSAPPRCSGWHRGDSESREFDLGRTERGHRESKEALSEALSK